MCSQALYNAEWPGRSPVTIVKPSAGSASVRSAVLATILIITGGLGCLIVAAQTVEETAVINREYAIKAAFLYHFLTYVEWPSDAFDSPDEPFVIGVFKTDPFGEVLDKIAETKTAGGRPILVRRLNSMSDVTDCHILFVPKSVPMETQDAVLAALRGSHVFAVGESDDFVDRGGAAQFFLEGNKVRFTFNTDAVENKSLKISSKLLSLAKSLPDR